MVVPVNVASNPQSERARTTKTPCSEPKTRFGEYRGLGRFGLGDLTEGTRLRANLLLWMPLGLQGLSELLSM